MTNLAFNALCFFAGVGVRAVWERFKLWKESRGSAPL